MTDTQSEAYISEQEIMQNIEKVREIVYHRHPSQRVQAIAMNALLVAQEPRYQAKYRLQALTHAIFEYNEEQRNQ